MTAGSVPHWQKFKEYLIMNAECLSLCRPSALQGFPYACRELTPDKALETAIHNTSIDAPIRHIQHEFILVVALQTFFFCQRGHFSLCVFHKVQKTETNRKCIEITSVLKSGSKWFPIHTSAFPWYIRLKALMKSSLSRYFCINFIIAPNNYLILHNSSVL